jgi:hypothetical protein
MLVDANATRTSTGVNTLSRQTFVFYEMIIRYGDLKEFMEEGNSGKDGKKQSLAGSLLSSYISRGRPKEVVRLQLGFILIFLIISYLFF